MELVYFSFINVPGQTIEKKVTTSLLLAKGHCSTFRWRTKQVQSVLQKRLWSKMCKRIKEDLQNKSPVFYYRTLFSTE